MFFDKNKFKENASKGVKQILSGHLDSLDGLEVLPHLKGYWIPLYVINNERFYLYPVDKLWTSSEKQESLF